MDLDRETERHSEEASSRPTSQHSSQEVDEDSDVHEYVNVNLHELSHTHSLQKVNKDSDKHDYVNNDVVSPREEQKLKEEHNNTGTAESIQRPPIVVPRQPLARHKAAGIAQSLVESRNDTEVAAADLPNCEKCGRTFPWNKLHLRWKHTCEPSEATGSPQPRCRSQTSAPDF